MICCIFWGGGWKTTRLYLGFCRVGDVFTDSTKVNKSTIFHYDFSLRIFFWICFLSHLACKSKDTVIIFLPLDCLGCITKAANRKEWAKDLGKNLKSPSIMGSDWVPELTAWKIDMEPTNHPFRKENDLNQTFMIMFQPLIFRDVTMNRFLFSKLHNVSWLQSSWLGISLLLMEKEISLAHYLQRQLAPSQVVCRISSTNSSSSLSSWLNTVAQETEFFLTTQREIPKNDKGTLSKKKIRLFVSVFARWFLLIKIRCHGIHLSQMRNQAFFCFFVSRMFVPRIDVAELAHKS